MSTSTENIPKAGESGARASDDLLEIARATGLRQYMYGVNATDARFILQRFVDALRFLHADSDAPAAGRTMPEAIRTMAQRIAADKFEHCTADPIFTVQKRNLLSGLDLDYCDDIGWFYDGDQLLGEEAVTLEAEYQDSGTVPDNHTRTGIMETWEHYATYITQESAQEFVAKKGDEYRVYVDSGCRNHEWKALRAFLEDVAAAPTPPTSAADAADAARYRWLRDESPLCLSDGNHDDPEFTNITDASIDAAIAASKESGDGVTDPAA